MSDTGISQVGYRPLYSWDFQVERGAVGLGEATTAGNDARGEELKTSIDLGFATRSKHSSRPLGLCTTSYNHFVFKRRAQ